MLKDVQQEKLESDRRLGLFTVQQFGNSVSNTIMSFNALSEDMHPQKQQLLTILRLLSSSLNSRAEIKFKT